MTMPSDTLLSFSPPRTVSRLLQRTTPPFGEPLTLTEAKLHLRITSTAEDALLTGLIVSVRMHAECWLRRSLMTQGWTLSYDDALPLDCRLPMGPVTSIASITLYNEDGTSNTLSSGLYRLNAGSDGLRIQHVLSASRIAVAYQAGYGAAGDVPQPIRQGMLQHLAALYESREGITAGAPPAVSDALYAPYRAGRL